MAHEAPRTTTGQPVFKKKTSTDRVFGLIKMSTVGTITMGPCNHAKELLNDVKLVRSQVIEVASAGNIGLQTPRQRGGLRVIKVTRRYRKTNLNIRDITDNTVVDNAFDSLKIRKITPVVGYKTRNRSEEHTSELQSRQYLV